MASQMGYEITSLIAGSVVIEKIFGYPGVGKLFIDSIGQRDYTVITSLVIDFRNRDASGGHYCQISL